MTIFESLINKMFNNWYIIKNDSGELIGIRLENKTTYHDNTLEFYMVRFNEYQVCDFSDGYYIMLKLNEFANYSPIDEVQLNDKFASAFARELLRS